MFFKDFRPQKLYKEALQNTFFKGRGGAIFLGGNFPGGNFPGSNFPGGNFPGGTFPGGIFPGGILPSTMFCIYTVPIVPLHMTCNCFSYRIFSGNTERKDVFLHYVYSRCKAAVTCLLYSLLFFKQKRCKNQSKPGSPPCKSRI